MRNLFCTLYSFFYRNFPATAMTCCAPAEEKKALQKSVLPPAATADTPAPKAGTTAPVADSPAPVAETTAPVACSPAPVAGSTALEPASGTRESIFVEELARLDFKLSVSKPKLWTNSSSAMTGKQRDWVWFQVEAFGSV